MRVLVACEFSGIVRNAFSGHCEEAWSCDLEPTEKASMFHYQRDVREVLDRGWDLLIAHPPCTFLSNSGVKHLYIGGRKENGIDHDRWARMKDAATFFYELLHAPIPRICVENPIPHGHAGLPKPTQIIQPWQFGHGETKATCLWLKGLPKLVPTEIVAGRTARIHRMAPSPTRGQDRSRTYPGIAQAMADQWGVL